MQPRRKPRPPDAVPWDDWNLKRTAAEFRALDESAASAATRLRAWWWNNRFTQGEPIPRFPAALPPAPPKAGYVPPPPPPRSTCPYCGRTYEDGRDRCTDGCGGATQKGE